MKLPNQAVPVLKASKVNYRSNGMQLSQSTACTACLAACGLLSGWKKTLCIAACNATVC